MGTAAVWSSGLANLDHGVRNAWYFFSILTSFIYMHVSTGHWVKNFPIPNLESRVQRLAKNGLHVCSYVAPRSQYLMLYNSCGDDMQS